MPDPRIESDSFLIVRLSALVFAVEQRDLGLRPFRRIKHQDLGLIFRVELSEDR
jgi:hypothetical protein